MTHPLFGFWENEINAYWYFLLSQMYSTKPIIIAPIEPNWTKLTLFHPKKWLSTNTIAAIIMMIMPKFFISPFIMLFCFFWLYLSNILQRNTIFFKWENKINEKLVIASKYAIFTPCKGSNCGFCLIFMGRGKLAMWYYVGMACCGEWLYLSFMPWIFSIQWFVLFLFS